MTTEDSTPEATETDAPAKKPRLKYKVALIAVVAVVATLFALFNGYNLKGWFFTGGWFAVLLAILWTFLFTSRKRMKKLIGIVGLGILVALPFAISSDMFGRITITTAAEDRAAATAELAKQKGSYTDVVSVDPNCDLFSTTMDVLTKADIVRLEKNAPCSLLVNLSKTSLMATPATSIDTKQTQVDNTGKWLRITVQKDTGVAYYLNWAGDAMPRGTNAVPNYNPANDTVFLYYAMVGAEN